MQKKRGGGSLSFLSNFYLVIFRFCLLISCVSFGDAKNSNEFFLRSSNWPRFWQPKLFLPSYSHPCMLSQHWPTAFQESIIRTFLPSRARKVVCHFLLSLLLLLSFPHLNETTPVQLATPSFHFKAAFSNSRGSSCNAAASFQAAALLGGWSVIFQQSQEVRAAAAAAEKVIQCFWL